MEENNLFSDKDLYETQEDLMESAEPQEVSGPVKQVIEPQFVTPLKAEKEQQKKEKGQKGLKSIWVVLIACGLALVIGAMSGFVSAKLTNVFSTKDGDVTNNVNTIISGSGNVGRNVIVFGTIAIFTIRTYLAIYMNQ